MTVHHFKPTKFYSTIGSHPAALRIDSGDSVNTTCLDAWGHDADMNVLHEGSNPMTGPFFINHALPGDTLAVTFDEMQPNRTLGLTRNLLAPNVVDPDFARNLPDRKISEKARWNVDAQRGSAMLEWPVTKLGRLELALRPMMGCFGVAPAGGEAISTATSAQHGGNMDWNGFGVGVTVYFPVAVEGALFHLGDGHALQGDGEMAGTGIEISMNVQFTVRVIKNWRIDWPRAENATHIITAGNARPLDQATQHATTEMSRWLSQDYGLDHIEVGLLMGQAVQYELGNMFDPAYTMICKLPKRLFDQISKL